MKKSEINLWDSQNQELQQLLSEVATAEEPRLPTQTTGTGSQLRQTFAAQGHAGPYASTYSYGNDNKKAYLTELLLGLNEFAYKSGQHM